MVTATWLYTNRFWKRTEAAQIDADYCLKNEMMDSKPILMAKGEIEEQLLSCLMKEVAAEAIPKAAVAKKQMQERIAQEIEKAKSRYQATYTS